MAMTPTVASRSVRFTESGQAWISARDLTGHIAPAPTPDLYETRRYFGQGLSPAVIESVLRQAELGYMRDLTDLTYETYKLDPHLTSVTGKRFRGLAAMRPQVVPAEGDGIDEQFAQLMADVVRQQLAWLPNFRQSILQLNWAHCFGRGALEKIWRENPPGSDVQWSIDRLNWVHPRRIAFGPERELRIRDDLFDGMPFSPRGLELRALPFKFISFTPQQFNDYPEREGFGPRALYWSFFKRFSWRERLVLLEVFGRPWRIVFAEENWVQKDTLKEAAENVDALAANATGALPPGVKVDTSQPEAKAGENHQSTSVDADDQISKLVLGQTRTTDAKPNAIGSSGDEVAQGEQDEIKDADGWNISDVLTEQLSCDIVVLNYGAEAIDHAPRIELRYERARDPSKELDRAKVLIVDMGAPVKRDELYERAGFSKPESGDDVVTAPAQPAFPGLPGLPSVPGVPSVPGQDGSPLGDDGAALPDTGDQFRADSDVTLLRAARVLALMNELQRR